jgi:hypothetical protein
MKDIIGDLLEIKLNDNLEPKDYSFALDFAKSNSLEKVINGREKRKKTIEIGHFLESININKALINDLSLNLVEAAFPIQKTAALEYVLEHKNPNELLLLIKRVQQSLSFSDTISKTSSRASDVVKELTKLAKKENNTEKVKINLSENINSIVSVYKYKLDNAQININIPENAEIIAIESKMHHLWKSMIMMACNNYKEDQEEKSISFDYSVNAQFNNVSFKFNGPQIEKYILDNNHNIGRSEDQDDLNLNLRIVRKIAEDISGSFEIDSAPDNNIFTIKIPHTPAKKSLILQQSLAHKKSPTRRL